METIEKIKIGDRILVKRLFTIWSKSPFHAHVKAIGKDLLGKYYWSQYTVSTEFGDYQEIGKFRNYNILYKD